MTEKWVYLLDEVEAAEKHAGRTWDGVRGLLGGKGANLAEMARIGVPVPPGFTVTTEACNAYLASGGKFPEGLWEQELAALKVIEEQTGKRFGDAANPLLVSCRSGAKFSMPGMMDTVLNIGLNNETAHGMVALTGDERFVYDAYRRLVQMFGNVVMGVPDDLFEEVVTEARMKAGVETDAELGAEEWKAVTREFQAICRRQKGYEFPRDPFDQLRLATEAVFKSWNGKRAVDYRNAAGIAVSIVTMVFGNMGDDSATGERQIEGDYLTNAQGEDVVAGIRLTKDISALREEMPDAFAEFEEVARKLENHYREMQDVEFTMALYIGQGTSRCYAEAPKDAKTVAWNDPIGAFELERFSRGTTVSQAQSQTGISKYFRRVKRRYQANHRRSPQRGQRDGQQPPHDPRETIERALKMVLTMLQVAKIIFDILKYFFGG